MNQKPVRDGARTPSKRREALRRKHLGPEGRRAEDEKENEQEQEDAAYIQERGE